jgi:hypothetical protein
MSYQQTAIRTRVQLTVATIQPRNDFSTSLEAVSVQPPGNSQCDGAASFGLSAALTVVKALLFVACKSETWTSASFGGNFAA